MAAHHIGIQRIQRVYPELEIRRIRSLGSGQYNDVLLVNDDLVFRLPRYASALAELRHEVGVLRGLRGCLPVAIPDPLYASLDGDDVAAAFMGYRVLPGMPLTRDAIRGIADEATRSLLAEQLTGFLRALHTMPLERFDERPPVVAGYSAWIELYARFRKHLFPALRPEARRAVAADFERYLSDEANAAIALVLVHGDFGPGNILYDAEQAALTGVLDWSSAGLGDPAVDLAALICAMGYGEDFVRLGCGVYPELAAMLPRAHFYASTFALQEALFGMENGDAAAFERGIAAYR